MVKIVGTFAVIVVGAWTLAPGAHSSVASRSPVVGMKGDRLDINKRTPVCSQHAWPYYDSACLYDSGRGEARKVRVIVIDRLPSRAQNAESLSF